MNSINIISFFLVLSFSIKAVAGDCRDFNPDFKKLVQSHVKNQDDLKRVANVLSDRIGYGIHSSHNKKLNSNYLINLLNKSYKDISNDTPQFRSAAGKYLYSGNDSYKKTRPKMVKLYKDLLKLRRKINLLKKGSAEYEKTLAKIRKVSRERVTYIRDNYKYLILKALEDSPFNINSHLLTFWFNHLNVNLFARQVELEGSEYIKKIQLNMCNTFEEMLLATSQTMPMMHYLDNFRSRHGAINENYGREIMELHTFGRGPRAPGYSSPYTQSDIINASKILTGWGYDKDYEFSFNKNVHHSGPALNLLGKKFNSGYSSGVNFIQTLARHNVTKNNICSKMTHYLYGSVNKSIVSSCVKAYGVKGNLAGMYKSILSHKDFWTQSAAQTKSPLELSLSALIKSGVNHRSLNSKLDVVYTGAKKSISKAKTKADRFYSGSGKSHSGMSILETTKKFVTDNGQPLTDFAAPTGWPLDRGFYLSVSLLKAYESYATFVLSRPGLEQNKSLGRSWELLKDKKGDGNRMSLLSKIQIEDLGASEEFMRDENVQVLIDAFNSPRNFESIKTEDRAQSNLFKNQLLLHLISKSNFIRR